MKTIFFSCLFFVVGFSVWGQSLTRKNWQYHLEGNPLSNQEVKELYHSVPQALKQHKKAQLQFGISSGLLLLGGAYTGERLGRWTATGQLDLKQTGIGVGVVALGLVSSIGLHKKYDRAVSLYNNQKPKKTSLILSFDATKLAINVRF
jgi:hypothetical protein